MNEVIEVNKVRIKKRIKFLKADELLDKFIMEELGELKEDFEILKSSKISVFIPDGEENHAFFRGEYNRVKNKKIKLTNSSDISLYLELYFNNQIKIIIKDTRLSIKAMKIKRKWEKYSIDNNLEKKINNKINQYIENKINQYIEKDKYRFNGENYSNKIYDINKGSWDLYEALDKNNVLVCHDKNEEYEEVMLDSPIYARNPEQDCRNRFWNKKYGCCII